MSRVELPGKRRGRRAGLEFHARLDLEGETVPADAVIPAPAGKGPVIQLAVARLDSVAETLLVIKRLFIALWIGAAVAGGVLIWIVVRRSLRPLGELQASIGALHEPASPQRIVLGRQPEELRPVTDELNRLLGRVEEALLRERTLTSNVAHELRTPLSGILASLETTLSRERSAEEYRRTSVECLESAKRLHWLVENLLSLARVEAGHVPVHRRTVNYAEVLATWWQPFAGRAAARRLRVEWAVQPGAGVETDAEFLRVVVNNLFDNAVSYAPEGGVIRIAADSRGHLSVANEAPEMDAASAGRAFDSFWRQDRARAAMDTHVGLGLSLCRKIAELLGGGISAQIEEPGNRFVVRVQVPA
jgi:two-component system heavy metal sensor histidine kinase CusS